MFETTLRYRENNLSGNVAPSDAVAAMNHIKRLHRQAKSDRGLKRRVDTLFGEFSATAQVNLGCC